MCRSDICVGAIVDLQIEIYTAELIIIINVMNLLRSLLLNLSVVKELWKFRQILSFFS